MNNIQKHFKRKADDRFTVSVHGNLGVSASGSQNENHNHAYQERT